MPRYHRFIVAALSIGAPMWYFHGQANAFQRRAGGSHQKRFCSGLRHGA
jgi:hypothetical protein